MRSFEQEGSEHGHEVQGSTSVQHAQTPSPAQAPTPQKGRGVKDVVATSVVVVGIVIVLVALGWIGISAVRALPNGVDAFATAVRSFFTREEIIVGINPDTIPTNESRDVVITWRHSDKNSDGFYAFRHGCADGVSVKTQGGATIFCGSTFRFEYTENTLAVNVTASTSVAETEVPFVITFTPNSTEEAVVTGSVALTIINTDIVESDMTATSTDAVDNTEATPTSGGAPIVTVPSTPRTIIVDTTPTSNPNGTPDLAVSLLAIGIVDEDTGAFTPRNGAINLDDLSKDESVAVRFVVENLGDKTVEAWSFEARLPTSPSKTFEAKESDTGPLLPGTRTEFTLGFDRAKDGDVSVRIEVDHNEDIDESNEGNNVLNIPLTLTED